MSPARLSVSRAAAGPLRALVLACGLGAAVAAQAGGAGAGTGARAGTVRGSVVGADGRPVAGAQVVVRPLGGGDGRTLATAADGTYAQRDVAAGLHAVTASRNDRHSEMFRIRLRAGRTVEINLQLAAGRRAGAWLAELGDREAASRAFAAGLAASRAADHATAVRQFARAVERRPDCAECSYNLAIAYADLERFPDAEAAFRQVLAIAPDYPAAYYGLASIYARQGRAADAAAARGEATRLALAGLAERRRRLEETLARGIDRLHAGEVNGARADFERILDEDSSFAPTHYWLAMSLLRSNATARAAAALRRYLELAGDGQHAARARAALAGLER